MTPTERSARAGHLVQAVDFEDRGGWVLDSQFDMQMGAPYLLAHGLGVPVAEARTTIEVTQAAMEALNFPRRLITRLDYGF